MKKRILAMLLVLCLVASVMPMTVLAANQCPAEHNLNNCESTFVQSVAAATCQQQSYDLYACNACGELFAENFGDFGPHNYIYDDGDTQYACGYGKHCVNCPDVLPHVYNCEGKCSCGATSGNPGHVYDEDKAVIIEAPVNCTVPGKAEYTCENCGEKKIAEVIGAHIWGDLVPAKSNSCTQDGNIAYYECSGCGAYKNELGQAVESVVIPAAHQLPVTVETVKVVGQANNGNKYTAAGKQYVIIEAGSDLPAKFLVNLYNAAGSKEGTGTLNKGLGGVVWFEMEAGDYIRYFNHGAADVTANVQITVITELKLMVAPTCYSAGIYQVECQICDYVATKTISQAAHDWHLQAEAAPTCTTHGYEIYACVDCGKIETVPYEPVNCFDTYAEVKAWNEAKNEDGSLKNIQIPVGKLDPTCANKGYYSWTCPLCGDPNKIEEIPALGCDIKTQTVNATLHHAGVVFTYCARANCDCHCTCSLNQLYTGGCICGHTNEISKLAAIDSNLASQIDAQYNVHKILGTTAKLRDTAANADKHDWIVAGTTASCKQAGNTVYICLYCTASKTVAADILPHEAYDKDVHGDKIVVAPTCCAQGYSYYVCSGCNEQIKSDYTSFVKNSILTESQLKIDHNVANPSITPVVAGDCTKFGYGSYYCSACKTTILVIMDGTGSHKAPAGFKLPEASCYDQAWAYNCATCGEVVSGTVKGSHVLPNAAVKGDCLTEGYNAYGKCSVCGVEIPKEVDPNTGKHAFSLIHTYVADCENWGGELYECSVCGLREVREYISVSHNYVLNTQKSDAYAGCMSSGTQYWECADCDAEYTVALEGLGYHVNWNGYKIDYSACPECNKAANNLNDAYFWHIMRGAYNCQYCNKNLENLGRDATCTQDGYLIYGWTCGHSGYNGYVEKLDHDYQPADYGTFTCKECVNGCGAQKDLVSTGKVEFSISNDIGKKVITDGSIVGITIDISAYKSDLFGYSFQLAYNGAALEFVRFESLTENFKYNALVQNNIVKIADAVVDQNGNVITPAQYSYFVSIIGQSMTDGKNVNLTGTEELITVYFKVVDPTAFCAVAINNLEVVKNGKNAQNKIEVQNVETIGTLTADFGAKLLMDADLNGVVNYKDAAIVWQMASGALEYNYAENLDLNGNGEIDAVDAKLIYQYFVGILTYEEVLNYNA